MTKGEEFKEQIKERVTSVRLRTLSLTIALVIALIFYYLVNVATKQSISWIDFVLICLCQILAQTIYFPDGEIFGTKDKTYISNRGNYNDKAEQINMSGKHESLQEYCDYEYEQRKKRYILTQCGYIGISENDLEKLKEKSKTDLKHIKKYERKETIQVNGEDVEKVFVVHFSARKRKLLYNLIFKPLPVQKNNPETIMSAVENDGSEKIKDTSIPFKRRSYVRKILMAILLGLIFGYSMYTMRDGIGFGEIVSIIFCLVSLFGTAVTAFSSGETCTKVYKSRFYLELGNFIDGFLEWDKTHGQKRIV